LSELRNAIAEKLPANDQRFLLHEFEMELRDNCRGEEQMIALDRFPDRQDHESLFRLLSRLETTLISGDSETALEEIRPVSKVLFDHITAEDARIASWHRITAITPDSPD
jgi:hypothetical protein